MLENRFNKFNIIVINKKKKFDQDLMNNSQKIVFIKILKKVN